MPSALLLAHIQKWVAELERVVEAFEAAVEEVEEEMEKAEQEDTPDDSYAEGEEGMPHRQESEARPIRRLERLEQALAKADRVAGLVNAARTRLDEALCAAQQIMADEHVGAPPEQEQQNQPGSQRVIQAARIAPGHAEQLSIGEPGFEPLPPGATILGGRYRIVELLHSRPRINLYLADRLAGASEQEQDAPAASPVAIREIVLAGLSPDLQKGIEKAAFEEFVAPGLLGSPRLPGVGDRILVEHERHYLVMQLRPAREEREAKTGSRVAVAVPFAELLLKHQQWPEWLDMQTALEWGIQLCRIVARLHRMGIVLGDLDPSTILVSGGGPSSWAPVLLVSWPPALQFWLGSVSREQYAHIFPVAENRSENAFAAPETLAGVADVRSDIYSLGAILYLLFARYAPVAAVLRQPVEQAAHEQDGPAYAPQEEPELLEWPLSPASSPVPPPDQPAAGYTARTRLAAGWAGRPKDTLKSARVRLTPFDAESGIALVPPHLFNNLISPRLEAMLLRALALSPAERFPSVFALVEALEAIDPGIEFVDHLEGANQARPDSGLTKALERMRRKDNRAR